MKLHEITITPTEKIELKRLLMVLARGLPGKLEEKDGTFRSVGKSRSGKTEEVVIQPIRAGTAGVLITVMAKYATRANLLSQLAREANYDVMRSKVIDTNPTEHSIEIYW